MYSNLDRFNTKNFWVTSKNSSKNIKKLFRLTFSSFKNIAIENIPKKNILKLPIKQNKLFGFIKFKLVKTEQFVLIRMCSLYKKSIIFLNFLNFSIYQKYDFKYKQLKIKKFFDLDSLFSNKNKILIGKISDSYGKIFSLQSYIKFINKEDCFQLYNYFKKNQRVFPVPKNAGYLFF
jgi:hypothetical protein